MIDIFRSFNGNLKELDSVDLLFDVCKTTKRNIWQTFFFKPCDQGFIFMAAVYSCYN